MKKTEAILFENVNFGYSSQNILSDVNFRVMEKEIISIVGPNGGGKTTLLRLMLGFIKPNSGTILIKGKKPDSGKKIMGYVPQHMTLDKKFPITVEEVILSGRIRPFGFYTKEDRKKAEQMLQSFELNEIRKERFSEISGGQVQRMLIARAILSDVEILLLDEPTSNIDNPSQNRLNELLKDINKDMTILIVTHDTGFVSNITDRVFCINRKVKEHSLTRSYSELNERSNQDNAFIVRHDTIINAMEGGRKK